jgi:hypothetical protein
MAANVVHILDHHDADVDEYSAHDDAHVLAHFSQTWMPTVLRRSVIIILVVSDYQLFFLQYSNS